MSPPSQQIVSPNARSIPSNTAAISVAAAGMVSAAVGGASFVSAIFGFTVVTLVINLALEFVGIAFAFEATMKIWTQEFFPTLLRSSTQGAIFALARVLAASLAVVTLALLATPELMYGILAAIAGLGVTIAWLTFRNAKFDAFNVESQDLTEGASSESR